MWRAVLGASLVACGRLGFEPASGVVDATSGVDTTSGEHVNTRPCGRSTVAPPNITLGGETFRYTSFDNARATVSGVGVTVIDDERGVIASVASNSDGAWSLMVPTGGEPIAPTVKFSAMGYFTTKLHVDVPLDGDAVAPPAVALWTMPHGPVWSPEAMTSVYGTLATRDLARSTMNIAVRDCSDAVITGAIVELSPPAERVVYQANDGTLDENLSMTTGRFGHAIAFNVPPGTIQVRARKDGVTFYDQDVVVVGGEFNDLVVLRQLD